jgi:peptide subunit release factor 1 (eRF1)
LISQISQRQTDGTAMGEKPASRSPASPLSNISYSTEKKIVTELYQTATLAHHMSCGRGSEGGDQMDRRNIETVGVRRTGWAALDRDPQEDRVEFVCPHCGTRGQKNARRERTQYHFTDGFLQDLQGEVTQCRSCGQSLRVVPVVMLHDQDETRRFEAVFSEELPVPAH